MTPGPVGGGPTPTGLPLPFPHYQSTNLPFHHSPNLCYNTGSLPSAPLAGEKILVWR